MPDIEDGVRINVTTDEEKTYNSKNLQSFTWRKKDGYRYGQLMVVFQGSITKYFYDVPRIVFKEMAKRAYNQEDYTKSTWEWYDSNIVDYVDIDRTYPDKDNVLYIDKYSSD